MEQSNYLTGHLLIAMPSLMDPNFSRTVTYICEHSDEGAIGLVINRPLDIDLGEVFRQLNLDDADPDMSELPVLHGGPVQMDRGFVIHDSAMPWESTTNVADSIHVTTSQDILLSMAGGKGPNRAAVALGYAGWGAGQLEREMAENSWLSTPADTQILFDTPFADRWREAAGLIGIDPDKIAPDAGHA